MTERRRIGMYRETSELVLLIGVPADWLPLPVSSVTSWLISERFSNVMMGSLGSFLALSVCLPSGLLAS